jgi:hypothetical protein
MTYRPCVFCNKTDSRPSREHVLAEWISAEFPGTTMWEMENTVKRTKFKDKQIALVTRKPCKRCNETWMSKLESTAKPLLVPLMKGKTILLTPDRQLLIARWFAKTVIMYEMLTKEPYYFQPEERYALHNSLQVPTQTNFSLAHYSGRTAGSTFSTHLKLLVGAETDHPVQVNGYTATLTIKKLALQVFSLRLPPEYPPDTVRLEMPVRLRDMGVQIWPINNALVRWPPRYFLDNRALGIFQNRWTTLG